MLTQTQIETFVARVEEDAAIGIDEDSVVETQDAIADFTRQWGGADDVCDGLHIWFKVQAAKGQPRRTLCVFDFGDVRAACTC